MERDEFDRRLDELVNEPMEDDSDSDTTVDSNLSSEIFENMEPIWDDDIEFVPEEFNEAGYYPCNEHISSEYIEVVSPIFSGWGLSKSINIIELEYYVLK